MIPFNRQSILLCQNGLFLLTNNHKTSGISIVNSRGRIIVPFDRYSQYATPPLVRYDGRGDDVADMPLYWVPLPFEPSVYFENYIGVKKGQKWAVINENGKEIIPPKFDWIGIFNKDAAPMRIGKHFGVTSAAAKDLVPTEYDNTILSPDNFVIATKNEKKGVLSIGNKLLIPFKYEHLSQVNHNAFLADTGKNYSVKYGVINSENKIIIPLNNVSIEKFGTGFLVHQANHYTALFDSAGIQQTDFVTSYRLTYPVLEIGNGKTYIVYNEQKREFIAYEKVVNLAYYRDKKWGLLDLTGNEVTPPKYDEIRPERSNYHLVSIEKKYGLINSAGKELIPCLYDYLQIDSPPLIIANNKGLLGLINYEGKTVQPVINNEITLDILNGKFVYNITRKGKRGIVNDSGKQIMPFLYDGIERIDPGNTTILFRVRNSKQYGITDYAGKIIVPLVYENIGLINFAAGTAIKYYSVRKNGKTGIIDSAGKLIIPFEYTSIKSIQGRYLVAGLNGKYGLISWSNKMVTPFIYDDIRYNGNTYVYTTDHKAGLLDSAGKVLISPSYDYIDPAFHHAMFVHTGNKIGMIDEEGKILLDPVYDSYSICGSETIRIEKDHLFGLIDYRGKVIYPCKYTYIKCADGKVVEIY